MTGFYRYPVPGYRYAVPTGSYRQGGPSAGNQPLGAPFSNYVSRYQAKNKKRMNIKAKSARPTLFRVQARSYEAVPTNTDSSLDKFVFEPHPEELLARTGVEGN